MITILTKESLASAKPAAKSKPGFRLMEHLRFVEQSAGRTVVEFAGTNSTRNSASEVHSNGRQTAPYPLEATHHRSA